MTATYHHTEQLRLKHLKVGELFRFAYDVKTRPWFRMDGTPGDQSIIFSAGQTYKKISPRKIQPATAWLSVAERVRIKHELKGQPCALRKGQGDLPVDTTVV